MQLSAFKRKAVIQGNPQHAFISACQVLQVNNLAKAWAG
jgi:hypothetical protein